jgi:hypothetical protein
MKAIFALFALVFITWALIVVVDTVYKSTLNNRLIYVILLLAAFTGIGFIPALITGFYWYKFIRKQ